MAQTTDAIKEATEDLKAQTQKLSDLNNQIASKAEIINNLAVESVNQLTSADSFVYIEPSVMVNSENILLMLFHSGKYPVYDIDIQISDPLASKLYFENLRAEGKNPADGIDFQQARGIIFAGDLNTIIPQSASSLTTIANTNNSRSFTAFISTRNGFYRETMTISKNENEGGYLVDAHLFKTTGGEDRQIWESPTLHKN